jgi:Kef-type K+ transport system membrane component KefB
MKSAARSVDLAQTRVGAILVSAAVIDDVVGLVLLR